MRIEKLSGSPDRAGRYHACFDNGDTLRLYRQTVEDFGLYPGMEMTDEDYSRLLLAAAQMSAKMRAVRIVSASSVSKRDLEHRLVQKGEDPEQAKAAVRWMEDMDLLDDRKTAEQIVNRCIHKGYGLMRAKQALYEKQIPKHLWADALADYPDQEDYIREYLCEKLSDPADQKQVKKAIDALIRRGHSYGAIRRQLEKLSLSTQDFLED
ncbi:MAG: regulatory protein RecX [Ruminococcaceae bacterium]|nr:regulatory protein RecX [Oscillospiraceae bacterium]